MNDEVKLELLKLSVQMLAALQANKEGWSSLVSKIKTDKTFPPGEKEALVVHRLLYEHLKTLFMS